MRLNFFLILLVAFIQGANAAPTVEGRCEVSTLETVFLGKGIIHGAKLDGVTDERMGDLFVKFDYVCKAWGNISDMRFETYNLNSSYGGGDAYVTNTWGVVAQAALPREQISGQNNNVVLRNISQNEVDSDGLIHGTVNVRMFQLDKNSKIGTWSGSNNFPAGTTRTVSLNRSFYIRFSDGNGRHNNIYTTNLPVDIYVYDSTCSIDYNSTVNVGDVPTGQSRSIPFSIALNCNDSVTVQNNISTVFTNASSGQVSLDSNNKTLNYVGGDGVLVNMNIRSGDDKEIFFGKMYDLSVSEMSDNSLYNMNYIGDFEALNGSSQGNFSFIVNFQMTYN